MIKSEWKNLFQNPILVVVMAAILMIPTIYAGLFLGSMWDPYGELDQLPVAVVNLDQPVEYDGKTLEIGNDLVETMKEDMTLDFNFTSEEDAKTGLKNETYYMVVTIPEGFSEAASSVTEKNPEIMQLMYETNPGTNYVASKLGESAMVKMEASIQKSVTETYAKAFMEQLSEVGDKLQEAADGTKDLYDGEVKVADGVDALNDGSNALYQGTSDLANGAGTLKEGTQTALNGAGELVNGADKLSSGAADLNTGAKSLADGSVTLADGAAKLANGASSVSTGASKVAEGATTLKNGLSTLNANSAALLAGATQLSGGLAQLNQSMSSDTTTSSLTTLISGSASMKSGLQATSNGLNGIVASAVSVSSVESVPNKSIALDQLKENLKDGFNADTAYNDLYNNYNDLYNSYSALYGSYQTLNANYQKLLGSVTSVRDGLSELSLNYNKFDENLNKGLGSLAPALSGASAGIAQLNTGAANLSAGLKSYTDGVASAAAGAVTLSDGATTLANGANELSGKMATLSTGASNLAQGSNKLSEGAGNLYTGTVSLKEGSTKLANGVQSLDSGAASLKAGSDELQSGAGKLKDGTKELKDGIPELTDGTQELMDGLGDGAAEIASANLGDQQAEMFANPVDTTESQMSTVANNGHAMAAYMMSVGLWVCCLAFCLMYPLTEYHGKLKNGLSWWLSKESVLALLAAASAVILVVCLHIFNGFAPARWADTIIAAVIAAEAFMAIMYFFNVLLGKVGSFLMLIFMVLQLAGSAGTYPIELSGRLAQKLHWYVPFTYTVEAFRSTISGGGSIKTYLIYLILLFVLFSGMTIILFQFRAKRLSEGKQTLYTYMETYGII